MTYRKQKGFTLVELLVVIAIVAVLAGALLIAINPQALIQKSRDSKRLQDMEALVKALNLALADGEITLAATAATRDSATGTQAVTGAGWVSFTIPNGKTGLSKFIPTLPVDPLNTGANVYSFASTVNGFELDAVLEHADNTAKMTTDGGNDPASYEVGTTLTIITPQ
jgi:prepilin-type N-terminal cleavage/methylation domain-containing protein